MSDEREVNGPSHHGVGELAAWLSREDVAAERLVDTATDGAALLDPENPEAAWVSPRLLQRLGFRASADEPPRAAGLRGLVHAGDWERLWQALQRSLAERDSPLNEVVRCVSGGGGTCWLRCRGMSSADRRGQARRVLVLFTEVTEQVETARELQQTQRALEACRRDMERVAAATSHDLQAPLRAVRSFAELMEARASAELGTTARRYLAHVISGAVRGQRLAAELVTFAREDAGEYASMGGVSLGEVVRLARADVEEELHAVSAELSVDELPEVWGNQPALRRVVRELLANSIRFRSRERVLRMEILLETRPQETVVHVRDNGIGFADEHGQRVFELFRTLHTAKEYPGNGFGLALVRRTMERHGGRAWARGREGSGCTLSVSFPLV